MNPFSVKIHQHSLHLLRQLKSHLLNSDIAFKDLAQLSPVRLNNPTLLHIILNYFTFVVNLSAAVCNVV